MKFHCNFFLHERLHVIGMIYNELILETPSKYYCQRIATFFFNIMKIMKMKSPIVITQQWTFVFPTMYGNGCDNIEEIVEVILKKWLRYCIYPNVEPFISSAWELINSAINSSLNASFGLRHFLPPGNTTGRSICFETQCFSFTLFISTSTFFCLSLKLELVLSSYKHEI